MKKSNIYLILALFTLFFFSACNNQKDSSKPLKNIKSEQPKNSKPVAKDTLQIEKTVSENAAKLAPKVIEKEKHKKIYSKNILSVNDFKQSLFYDKHKCRFDTDWALRNGSHNYAFDIIGIRPSASIDYSISKGKLKHIGLTFYNRYELDKQSLNLINDLIGEFHLGAKQKTVFSFIKKNIEKSAYKISETKPFKVSNIKFRAAKVIQQTLTIDIN